MPNRACPGLRSAHLLRWLVLASLALAPPAAHAQIHAWGSPLQPEAGAHRRPQVVLDGLGGHYVGWLYEQDPDLIFFGNAYRIKLTHLDAGMTWSAGWPDTGLRLTRPSSGRAFSVTPSTQGSAILTDLSYVRCNFCPSSPPERYAVLHPDGTPDSMNVVERGFMEEFGDGHGGYFDSFRSGFLGRQLRHFVPGDPTITRLIAGGIGQPEIVGPLADHQGGAWLLARTSPAPTELTLRHVDSLLVAWPGWPEDGIAIPPGRASNAVLMPEDTSAITVFDQTRAGTFMRRFSSNAALLDTGAIMIAAPTADSASEDPDFVSPMPLLRRSPSGRHFAFWRDAQRLLVRSFRAGDAGASSGPEGRVLAEGPGTRAIKAMEVDPEGGVVVVWVDDVGDGRARLFATRLDSLMQTRPGWPAQGRTYTAPDRNVLDAQVVSDGRTAMAVWLEAPSDTLGLLPGSRQIYTLRMALDTAADPGLPSGALLHDAQPSERGLTIRWQDAQGPVSATAARRIGNGPWAALGVVSRDPDGFYALTDSTASAGSLAHYRLQDGAGTALGETLRIVVPAPRLSVRFTLLQVGYEAGRIRTLWHSPPSLSPPAAHLQRSINGAAWTALQDVPPVADADFEYQDTQLEPASVHQYSIALADGTLISPIATVNVPVPSSIAIESLRRDAARNVLVLGLSLTATADAAIDLYDLNGRHVAGTRVRPAAPGAQAVELALPPHAGQLFVRLRQGNVELTRKLADVR